MSDKTDIETIKNTIVGMLNTDEKFHFEMADFCLVELDKIEQKHKEATQALKDEFRQNDWFDMFQNVDEYITSVLPKDFEYESGDSGENLISGIKEILRVNMQAQREACAEVYRNYHTAEEWDMSFLQAILSATLEDEDNG